MGNFHTILKAFLMHKHITNQNDHYILTQNLLVVFRIGIGAEKESILTFKVIRYKLFYFIPPKCFKTKMICAVSIQYHNTLLSSSKLYFIQGIQCVYSCSIAMQCRQFLMSWFKEPVFRIVTKLEVPLMSNVMKNK